MSAFKSFAGTLLFASISTASTAATDDQLQTMLVQPAPQSRRVSQLPLVSGRRRRRLGNKQHK